ncbi:MAG: sigma-70 family RNA polymerase sigma factor [Clostridia bacterium]|nr:sigma-70 family RNA polymerase sigma factor [Clostridia bacterium]
MSLYALAQAGDPDALAALVRQHMPLVQALSRRFPSPEDAFQQGCVGLVFAIRRYQEDQGFAFSTYAVPVILGEMRRSACRNMGWRTRTKLKRARDYQEQQLRQFGRMPPIKETAEKAGLPPEELAMLLEMEKGPVYDETGLLLSSLPDPGGDAWLVRFCIQDILSRLPGEESWLIRQRFLLGRTQTELAQALQITQSCFSRREKRARAHFQEAWMEQERGRERTF